MSYHIDQKEEMKRRIDRNKDELARRNKEIQKQRKDRNKSQDH